MSTYNKFDPKHYSGSYGVLQMSEAEAKAYLEYRLERIKEVESKILSKENIEEHSISDARQQSFREGYRNKRENILKDFEMMKSLEFKIHAQADYYLDRYFLLMEYKNVNFALSGAFESSHPVEEIAREMLLFVKDEGAVGLLKRYLDNKEKRCQK